MATIEDAFKASLEYFGGDELAANVFATKYALTDKDGSVLELTPSDMFRRVSKEFARIESKYSNPMSENEIFDLMDGFKYVVPQGSPLSAIGNNKQIQSVSNCFVIESPHDSYGGIMKTDQELVQISKRRGGVGFDLSSIRPKGLATMNAAKTTDGIEVFMERFSNSCREVAQNGRRGALMLTLSIHHPQVMDFIKIKQNKTKVTGANISLRISDEFMKAVEANEEYEQRWPVDSKTPVITTRVNAREVWDEIIKAAHGFAEPGVLFWDTILSDSPADIYGDSGFRTVSTNPCFTGDTKVAVADGRGSVTFKQLAEEGNDVPVYAYENKTGALTVKLMRNPRLTGKKASVCEVKMEDDVSFKVTGNHKMILWNGTRKHAEDLCANDQLWAVRHSNLTKVTDEAREIMNTNSAPSLDKTKRVCEWCQNDYSITWKKREQAFCSSECSTDFTNNKNDIIKKRASTLNQNSPKCENFDQLFIIKSVASGKEDVYNGTVDDEHTICTILKEFSDDTAILIASEQCGEIVLCERDSCRLLLVNLLSFVNNPFTENASFDYEKYNEVTIKSQRLMDDLIDLELEQIEKILNKIDNDPEPEVVKRAEKELWVGVRVKAVLGRRTGLGITALGDTLAALGIKYGSEESIEMTASIYKNLALSSYMSSTILAEERGKFPLYDYEMEKNHPFISRLREASPELDKRLKLFGRRNIAITTTAPAGSMSTMTQTTSGIEPAIFIDYTRRKKVNAHDENARIDFTDQSGDNWSEYKVYHHGFTKWKEINNKTDSDIEESPYWNATANLIDPIQKVKMQSAAQSWVCHSISNTCNLHKDVSLEVVNDIYMQAWKTKCKGITVYRDGSRTGVLVEKNTEELSNRAASFVANHAPKRPETVKCDIYRSSVGSDDWTIIVGLLDGKPYEIMGGFSSKIEIPRKYKTGLLDKKTFKSKQSIYTLRLGEGDDELSIKDVVSTFENPNHASFTRLLSLSLRHGAPVNYIVEQLLKGDKDADLFSLSKVISRVMKQYIIDGVKPGGTADCTSCGTKDSLRYTEGCLTCVNCAYSRCS